MGYATVRQALVDYFQPTPQMQKIYKEAPWIIQGKDFILDPGTTHGAVGFLHIDATVEQRITLPAYTGSKAVDYTAALVFLYKFLRPSTMPNGDNEDVWVDGLDELIDNLKAAIRADQTAGAPGVIFQMGTGAGTSDITEGPDITVEQDLPFDNGGGVFTLCRIQFHVYEIITA